MSKRIEKCDKTNKECGYLNFANDVLDLIKKYGIKDVVSLEKELKDFHFIKKCFYVSTTGGVFKTDFGDENIDKLKTILLNEQPNKGDRKYVAYFKKYYLYPDGRKYQDNAHFCISSLETDAIKRPFENDNIVVEELKVTERLTGKVIYQGTSYDKYLKVIRGLDNE